MRLIIHTRQGAAASGLRRYRGEGIFSSIGRKLFSSGLKKAINVATKANLPQKIANAVVNGAQSAGVKLGKAAGEKLGKAAGEKLGRIKKNKKRSAPALLEEEEVPQSIKHSKVDIDRLINGSGIIIE